MAIEELAGLLTGMAREQAKAQFFPVEYGTIVEDMVTGSDVRVKPDKMKLDLSYKNAEVVVSDGLILLTGDRVLIVGVNDGQDYAILARLSKDPSTATVGNGQALKATDRVVTA